MYEQRGSAHPLVRLVWRAESTESGEAVVPAAECWGVAFTQRPDGSRHAELAGPAPHARTLTWRAGDRHWGVELESHAFWSGLDKVAALGTLLPLPVDGGHVELAGVRFALPAYDDLEDLVDAMVGQGLLVSDPEVAAALAGEPTWLSERSLQRRFLSATGTRRKQIEQITRARHAYRLLTEGATPVEAALGAGYADQAHLTRSLRALTGLTPRQILTAQDGGFLQEP